MLKSVEVINHVNDEIELYFELNPSEDSYSLVLSKRDSLLDLIGALLGFVEYLALIIKISRR